MKLNTADIYRFSPRSTVVLIAVSAVSALGFLWPFIAPTGTSAKSAQWFFIIALPLALLLLIAELSNKNMDAKSVALLGVLAALIAALRPLGTGVAGIEPMWFLLILSARVFGSAFGFILGILSMLTSALLTGGLGPWLSYQIFAAAWIGLVAGLLPSKVRGRKEIAMLVVYCAFAALLFGTLMDLHFWPWALGMNTQLSFVPGAPVANNIHRFFIFHFATSMAWDIPRAIFTSTLVIITGPSVLSALRRTHFKASFLSPIEFIEHVKARKAE